MLFSDSAVVLIQLVDILDWKLKRLFGLVCVLSIEIPCLEILCVLEC